MLASSNHSIAFLIFFVVIIKASAISVPVKRSDTPINNSVFCYCQTNLPVSVQKYIGCGIGTPRFYQNSIYFTDLVNSRVRYIDLSTNEIITIAGSGSGNEELDEMFTMFCRSEGFSGDGGMAFISKLNRNEDVLVDPMDGSVIVMDTQNNRIRKIVNSVIDTIAGDGTIREPPQQGTLATNASVVFPVKGALVRGELFYLDWNGVFYIRNNRIYHYIDPKVEFSYAASSKIITFVPDLDGALYVSLLVDSWNYVLKFNQDRTWTHIMGTKDRQIDRNNHVWAKNSTIYYVSEMVLAQDGLLYFIDTDRIDISTHPFAEASYLKRIEYNGTVTILTKAGAGCTFSGLGIDIDGNTIMYTTNNQYKDDMKEARILKFYCPPGYTFANDKASFVPMCNSISAQDPKVCFSHGKCIGVNQCQCDANYNHNDFCEKPNCFGDPSDRGGCSGHGYCAYPDICKCDDGYEGARCQFVKCNNIPSNNTNVCYGRGTCIAVNYCLCDKTVYKGDYCELTLCNNIWSNRKEVCGGHGTCFDFDQCKCDSGYWGPNCGMGEGLFYCLVIGLPLLGVIVMITLIAFYFRRKFWKTKGKLELSEREKEDLVYKMNVEYEHLIFDDRKNRTKTITDKNGQKVSIKKIEGDDLTEVTEIHEWIKSRESDLFVQINQICKYPEHLYIQMKHYPLGDLAKFLRSLEPNSFERDSLLIPLLLNMVNCVKEVHDFHIHRDIKPENFLVDGVHKFNKVVLTDFEEMIWDISIRKPKKVKIKYCCANVTLFLELLGFKFVYDDIENERLLDEEEEVIGTKGYISPTHPNTKLGDVFALAVSVQFVLKKHFENVTDEKLTLAKQEYQDLENILQKMKSPDNKTSKELLEEIESFLISRMPSQD